MKDSLGDRMKRYEAIQNHYLQPNSWAVVRLDGRAFHTFTRGCDKPFDKFLIDAMVKAAIVVCKDIQGFKMAYVQSDEVNIVFTDTMEHESEHWFGGRVNKITSITAALMSVAFNNKYIGHENMPSSAVFDSRVFTMPEDDIANMFVWRQNDWVRNSVQMLGLSVYSSRKLHGRNSDEVKEMLRISGLPWEELSDTEKYGTFIDSNYQTFSERLDYSTINQVLRSGN